MAAVAGLSFEGWSGFAWRVHLAQFSADDATGSTIASGRFHRAQLEHPAGPHWRALYLSLGPDIPIGEILRHFRNRTLLELRSYCRTKLYVELLRLLDCRDFAALGLAADDLFDDEMYDTGQALGLAATRRGAEGILVRSATRAGDNLIVFPDNLLPESRLVITDDVLDLTHFVVG